MSSKVSIGARGKLECGSPSTVAQKKGVVWKRTRHSYRDQQDPVERAAKQADLEMLQKFQAEGLIDLFYLDESGFSLWMPVEYSYFFRGEQKKLEPTSRRGRRISILGLMQPQTSLVYGLVVGGFNSERYIKMMDMQAELALKQLEESGRIRVIVQDNGPIHTSKAVQAKWSQWQAQGLYLFFLPKYCSEMNLIETEWHQLKRDELVGRMFEDELEREGCWGSPSLPNRVVELAYAVIDGIDSRAEAGKYVAERFRFPSKLNTS